MELNTSQTLILIEKCKKCDYVIDANGTIYSRYKNGRLKEIPKRLCKRGYCEFKINNKHVSYHQIVAKYLVPNPNNGNKVFFNSSNRFDMRPQNLRWVWTREHQRLTPQEAIKRTKCRNLIAYYQTGNRRIIDSLIPDVLNKVYSIFDRKKVDEMLGELFELFYNYLERCLIFNIENDLIQTLRGLLKQELRKKVKTCQINERFI
ncbi:MAG: hypothetical protein ACYC25_12735 [Paludibacter sp.]